MLHKVILAQRDLALYVNLAITIAKPAKLIQALVKNFNLFIFFNNKIYILKNYFKFY